MPGEEFGILDGLFFIPFWVVVCLIVFIVLKIHSWLKDKKMSSRRTTIEGGLKRLSEVEKGEKID